MEDPNWFFSTLAQSAAAIVGLIGAFLVSKITDETRNIREREKEYIKLMASKLAELESHSKLNSEFFELKDEIQEIAKAHENYRKTYNLPSFFNWSIIILAFMAFFCIVLPMKYLSAGINTSMKHMFLILFSFSIFSLLIFFYKHLRDIERSVKP